MIPSFVHKSEARRFYLQERIALSQGEWKRRSDLIYEHLIASTFYQESETILIYVSAKDNEVDTHRIIDHALSTGKTVFVPVLQQKAPGLMFWFGLNSRSALVRGKFDLFEPAAASDTFSVPPDSSLCLIPGCAFSSTGHRLGYGGGYYDRFLEDYRGVRIGLGFALQCNAIFPLDPFDQALHYLITEEGLLSFHS